MHASKIFVDRDEVKNSFKDRMKSVEANLLIVGLTLESILIGYKPTLENLLNSNRKVKLLLLDPTSKHAEGHQPYSDRNIVLSIIETLDGRLKDLFNNLSIEARHNLEVKVTKYLPRFSAEIIDELELYINFHLYKSKANNNPVMYIKKIDAPDEFYSFYSSINKLYNDTENCIVKNGEWIGFEISADEDKYENQILANERLIRFLGKNIEVEGGLDKSFLKKLIVENRHEEVLDKLFSILKEDKILTNQVVLLNSWFNKSIVR